MIEHDDIRGADLLVHELGDDLAPVNAVGSATTRMATAASLTLVCGVGYLFFAGLRADLGDLSAGSVYAFATVRVAIGALLIFLAMRDSVPSAGPPRARRNFVLAAAAAAVVILPVLFAGLGAPVSHRGLAPLGCLPLIATIAIPAFLVAMKMLDEAYPLQPIVTCAAAGLGAGFLADAAIFLECNNAWFVHGFLLHGGATLLLGIAGGLSGWLIERRRFRGSSRLQM